MGFHIPAGFERHPAFTPAILENLILPNRFVRAATEWFCATPEGFASPTEIAAYRALGDAPVGTVITGNTCVSPEGRSGEAQNAFWDECFEEGQSAILRAARGPGRRVLLQLGHGGLRAEGNNGGLPVRTPDNMTQADLEDVIAAFTRAAVRAQALGFDGVELHAAHGYLLSQMFYPQSNHRTDRFGGSAEGRFRLVLEIVAEIKIACGDEFPVFVKLNGTNAVENEQYALTVCKAAELARREGVEAMELSGYDSAPAGRPDGPYFIENALRVHGQTGLPVILVGGVRTVTDVERALLGGISAVALCRPFLRRPDCIEAMFGGEIGCTGCNRCGAGPIQRARRCVLPLPDPVA